MVGDADGALRCPTCGKDWPVTHTTCPEDGAPLGNAVSMDAAFGSDTSIDAGPDRLSGSGTGQFDPFGSDIRTHLAHRPEFDDPAPSPKGAKSSDPPTVFVRRLEGHIELPSGSMVDDAYEIDHRLGAGAMGEVYAARHVKLGKRVAIKAISPRLSEDTAAVERFAQEARTLAKMQHPGLVDVLGFGELADGRAYFVMEYLSGESLFDRLQRGRLDRDEALDILGHIARALEAAHAHGVVHRDLKPENIFLARVTNEPRPIVKLLDFGLARLEVEVDRRAERTQSGVVIGTAMYLSPEQARGPDVDGRSDVYALGCIGYELLLGRHPFKEARTVAALIAAHMHETPPLPRSIEPSIAPELDLILFAMLAKDPQHRPTLSQIRSVVEGARTANATSPVVAVTAATAPPTQHPIGRGTIAVGLVVLAVGIIIGAAFRGARSEADKPTPSAIRDAVDAGGDPAPMLATVPDAGVPGADAESGLVDAGAVIDSAATVNASPTRTPPAQPRPTTTRGYLKILSPQGAQVLVDGVSPVGSVSRLLLAPGKHRIQFKLGSNKDSFLVTIAAGVTVTLDKRDLYSGRPDDRNQSVKPFEKKALPR